MRAISSVTWTHSSRVGVRTSAWTCELARIDLLDDRDAEGRGLAGAGLRLTDEVLATPQRRDGAGLHLGRRHEAHLLDGAGDRGRDLDVAEPVAAAAARTAASSSDGSSAVGVATSIATDRCRPARGVCVGGRLGIGRRVGRDRGDAGRWPTVPGLGASMLPRELRDLDEAWPR